MSHKKNFKITEEKQTRSDMFMSLFGYITGKNATGMITDIHNIINIPQFINKFFLSKLGIKFFNRLAEILQGFLLSSL